MKLSAVTVCALVLLLSFATSARAQVTVTEPPDQSNTVPGTTIALGTGVNRVSGSVATPGDRQDNFQVTVAAGSQLTAASLTLNTGGGFVGSVTFNLSEVRSSSGSFTSGFPFGPGTYYVQVITDFAIGNAWSLSFTVAGAAPVCGNGIREGAEGCDDGNATQCDGCSPTCAVVLNGCFIGGACIADGTAEPGNVCRACRRTVSRTSYSAVVAGTTCNDGQFCTAVDTCNGIGTCTGTTRSCSDSLSCTADACDEGANVCVNPVTSGCLIGGSCVASGTVSPANACLACAPSASTSAYSARPAGTSCDDGQYCTAVDSCTAGGTCSGTTRDCADPLSCTTDSCNEATNACVSTLAGGCVIDGACIAAGTASPTNACLECAPAVSTSAYSPRATGTSCDDGQFCTSVDACDGAGACGGTTRDCADALGCTTDTCDEAADTCVSTLASGCLVDGACVGEGETDPAADCMACDPASSTSAYSPAAAGVICDDGSSCSVDDACDGSGVCGGAAMTCTDDDACTLDACDEATGACTFEAISGCVSDAGVGEEDGGVVDDAGADDDGGVRTDGGVGADGGGVMVDGGAADGGGTVGTSGGCGCRAAGGSSRSGALFLLATVALGLAVRRRMR